MEVEERRMSGSEAGTTGRADGHSSQNGHALGPTLAVGRQQQQGSSICSLPMLASACPGWVCYAEKTHGDTVLPYISTARSPQVQSLLPSRTFISFAASRILGRPQMRIFYLGLLRGQA